MFEVLIKYELENDEKVNDFKFNIVTEFAVQGRNYQYLSGRDAESATFIIDSPSLEDVEAIKNSYLTFGRVQVREATTARLFPAFTFECPACGCEQVAKEHVHVGNFSLFAHKKPDFVFCESCDCDWAGRVSSST